ncbi:MAG: hypothetical protein KGP28_01330 [Bdellovibrionales bacterium]|nr:hypothetical protein [Bdellovibrionales bacterium]
MAHKASIFLLLLFTPSVHAGVGPSFESELRDAIAKNDWEAQVSLLQPKKGQNFEQDLQLAKALLQSEKRIESLKVLSTLYLSGREERITKLIHTASEMFFGQETSNLFFEGVRLLSIGKFADAKDRLDQANSREPGNVLVNTRLIQAEILTGAVDAASIRLKEVVALVPPSPELRAFTLKLALLNDDKKSSEKRSLQVPKRPYPTAQVPFVFTLETLKRLGKAEEIRSISGSLLKDHPKWTYAMVWAYSSGLIPDPMKTKLKVQIDRDLNNRDRFEKGLEREMSETQHFWVGYISFDELVNNSR